MFYISKTTNERGLNRLSRTTYFNSISYYNGFDIINAFYKTFNNLC